MITWSGLKTALAVVAFILTGRLLDFDTEIQADFGSDD